MNLGWETDGRTRDETQCRPHEFDARNLASADVHKLSAIDRHLCQGIPDPSERSRSPFARRSMSCFTGVRVATVAR